MTLITERAQDIQENLLQLVMHPKCLEHREAHRQQRHQGKQRGVDQTHGAQIELSVGKLVEHGVDHPQETNVSRPQAGNLSDIHFPHRFVEGGFDLFELRKHDSTDRGDQKPPR